MQGTLRQQAEAYLGTAISPSEWLDARDSAERKLNHIITHYGDAGGERNEPWYLAQLIAEAVRASRLTEYTHRLAELAIPKERQFGVKKGQPTSENVSRPISAPLL